jgi:hypothetical protein
MESRWLTCRRRQVVIPLSPDSRYPSKYIMYGPGGLVTTPKDPSIAEHDGCLEIIATPQHPKLGIDSHVSRGGGGGLASAWRCSVRPADPRRPPVSSSSNQARLNPVSFGRRWAGSPT